MNRKLFLVALVVALLGTGVMVGRSTGQIMPDSVVPDASDFHSSANAAALTFKADAPLIAPAGTAFTYQGSLKTGTAPANGSHDFQFRLYDAPTDGSQIGPQVSIDGVEVTGGLFTVYLDFGAGAFDGNARYLEVAVRQSGGGSYGTLDPRQPVSPAPYALFALKTAPYKNMVVVAQSGGDFTSIQAALNSITDASATNHYLVWVGPGVYTETVTMKQYVDIEGAGELSTKVTFTGSALPNTSTVLGANNAELRSLTVENTGGNDYAVGILNYQTSPSLLNVAVSASGGASGNYGVFNHNSSATMTTVTTSASGGATVTFGVYNDQSSPSMTNVIASGSGGTYNYGVYSYGGSTVTIANSRITGSTNAVLNGPGTTARIGASQLSGGPVNNAGTLICTASYDGNNKRLGADCTRNTKIATASLTDGDYASITAALNDTATWCGTPSSSNKCLVRVGPGTYVERVTMVQYVDIEGSGEDATKITFAGSANPETGTLLGASNAELRSLTIENTGGDTYATAIFNSSASPSLLHVTATAFGGLDNEGIDNDTSSPDMTNVTATASGGSGSSNIGVDNYASSSTMTNVTATASGGSDSAANFGVFNNASSPTMTNVTATASGGSGSGSYGVQNFNSSPKIFSSHISASGTSNNYGLTALFGGTVTMNSSNIIVPITNNTIVLGTGVTIQVGASQLSGGPIQNVNIEGTITCAGVYDENYAFFPSTCP